MPDLNEIFPKLREVEDSELREKVIKCWTIAMERGGWSIEDLDRIPFSLAANMMDISLAAHTRNVTDCSLAVGKVMHNTGIAVFKIDFDLLIAGGLLHDVGKLLEYGCEDGKWFVTKSGKMLRHPISGAALAAELKLPEPVQHIIAVHSHEGDKHRNSTEAWIVHHCDFINFDPIKK